MFMNLGMGFGIGFGGSAGPARSNADVLLGNRVNGVAFSFLDNSCAIHDAVTPANNYSGPPLNKFTFARVSTAMGRDANGLLASYAIDTPVYWYDANLNKRGLRIEGQATNLSTYSTDLSNPLGWVYSNATAVKNITGPDGVANSAVKLTENTVSSSHTISDINDTTIVANAPFTVSFWAKLLDDRDVALVVQGGLGIDAINCNIALPYAPDDYPGEINTIVQGTATVIRAILELWKDDWCRITLSGTINDTTLKTYFYVLKFNQGSYLGNGVSGVGLFGTQIEATNYGTSYIPTPGAASATRSHDQVALAETAMPPASTVATLYAMGDSGIDVPSSVNNTLFTLQDVTITQNTLYITAELATNFTSGRCNLVAANVSQAAITITPVYQSGQSNKYAVTAQINNVRGLVNADTIVQDVTATFPALDRLRLGSTNSTNAQLNGYITEGLYFPANSNDQDLADLTYNPQVT